MNADGGTRIASIIGAAIALHDADRWMRDKGMIAASAVSGLVAGVSVGVVDGAVLVDLCYEEDSAAEVDMNVVMTDTGGIVEIQGTAEHRTFDRAALDRMVDAAEKPSGAYSRVQSEALGPPWKLVIATKIPQTRRIRRDPRQLWRRIASLADYPELPDIPEEGPFVENALIKARAACVYTVSLAPDDSGLMVDALGGLPGIKSARSLPPLLNETRNSSTFSAMCPMISGPTIRLRAGACAPGRFLVDGGGVCEGLITRAPAGDGGFGYEPLILYPPLGLTFAEIPPR